MRCFVNSLAEKPCDAKYANRTSTQISRYAVFAMWPLASRWAQETWKVCSKAMSERAGRRGRREHVADDAFGLHHAVQGVGEESRIAIGERERRRSHGVGLVARRVVGIERCAPRAMNRSGEHSVGTAFRVVDHEPERRAVLSIREPCGEE